MTSQYIYGEDDRLLEWASARIPDMQFREEAVAIGHERNGELVGVAAYDNFSDHSCMFHLASDGSRRWLTRAFIKRAMAYPFIQCGFRRINCLVSVNNTDSLRFTEHFGWTPEGRLREEGQDGEDVIVFGLLQRECAWLFGTGKKPVSAV